METIIIEFDLKIRYQIYRFFADNCRAPSYQEVAYLLNAEKENVRVSFHTLFLRKQKAFLLFSANRGGF